MYTMVIGSVLDPDPFHFGNPDPFHERNRSEQAKYQPKSWKMSTKINQNQKNIVYFLAKILNF